jgi:hypothetical protein
LKLAFACIFQLQFFLHRQQCTSIWNATQTQIFGMKQYHNYVKWME